MNVVSKLFTQYIRNCHADAQHNSNNLSLCFPFGFPCIQIWTLVSAAGLQSVQHSVQVVFFQALVLLKASITNRKFRMPLRLAAGEQH